MLKCTADIPQGTCGVTLLYDFWESSVKGFGFNPADNIMPGGAGFITAGFIHDDKLSDKMFALLSSKYDVLFVSPVRLNRNSGNQFYFAVFSVKDVENDKYGFDDQDKEDEDEND
jgi:hypothetical protein